MSEELLSKLSEKEKEKPEVASTPPPEYDAHVKAWEAHMKEWDDFFS